jgi:hypothetical protein
MEKLLSGTHPVSVSVSVQSANNEMTVHPTAVTIAGINISGRPLTFLLRTLVLPNFPDAVIDKPFTLYPTISAIEVNSRFAVVKAR